VAVQGPNAVPQVTDALRELDADPAVSVIVVARGGGALEDLLAFSNETLVRAVSAATTPVVSAIGHEIDTPLLDLVADVRASTPTDAAKLVVPDVAEELAGVSTERDRLRRAITHRVEREQSALDALRSRPVVAAPLTLVEERRHGVDSALQRARLALGARLDRGRDDVRHLCAQVRALSPAATLDRGYAVVQRPDGAVVRSPDDVVDGDRLRVRVAGGELAADARRP
jgi:exodeoxyribonuclease VII large subunit